ncbi:MAG: cyclase family protein [Minicystis sp.]
MKRRPKNAKRTAGMILGVVGLSAAVALTANANVSAVIGYDPQPGPSPWGPDDEAGASNTQTPEKVLDAKQLIKSGKVYSLGWPYDTETLKFPSAHALTFTADTYLPNGRNFAFSENICGSFGQVGTQFDALGHFGILPPGSNNPQDTLFYNQFTGAETVTPNGLLHLGVEHVKPLVTRGVLLDIKRYANGGQAMAPGQAVTMDMVRTTLAGQRMKESDIKVGDVVLVYTGWEEKYPLGQNAYYFPTGSLSEPGINLEVAIWLADKGVASVGIRRLGRRGGPLHGQHPRRLPARAPPHAGEERRDPARVAQARRSRRGHRRRSRPQPGPRPRARPRRRERAGGQARLRVLLHVQPRGAPRGLRLTRRPAGHSLKM